MRFMRKSFTLVMVLLLASCLAGCGAMGTVTKPDTQVLTYEQTALFLNTVKPQLQVNCETKVLDAATCANLKVTYNAAVDAYQEQGNAQIAQLQAKTPADTSAAQAKAIAAKTKLVTLITNLQKYFK